jgi:hypothetical protein
MAESANLELINMESEPVLEQAVEPVLEQAVEPVLEQAVEPVLEQAVEPVLEQAVEPVLEQALEPLAPTKLDSDTISYITCVGKLLVKEKISYNILGMSGEIIFSGLGFYAQPCIYVAILLKTSGLYTFEIGNQIVSKQGSGVIEFYVIKNISILSTNIYTIKYTSTEPLAIYELNLADRCLCHSQDCF